MIGGKMEPNFMEVEFSDAEMAALKLIAERKGLSRNATVRQALRLYQLFEFAGGTINMPDLHKAPPELRAEFPDAGKFFLVIDKREPGVDECRPYGIFTSRALADQYIKDVEDPSLVIEEWMKDKGE